MKIIVAHPAKQHSYKTAEALVKKGHLCKYVTTVYYTGRGICKFISSILPKSYKEKFINKKNMILEPYVSSISFLKGFVYIVLMHIDKNKIIISKYHKILSFCFSKGLLKELTINKVDALISYDLFSTYIFRFLHERKSPIIKILDLSSIPALNINQILLRELDNLKNNSIFSKDIKKKLLDYSTSNSLFFNEEIFLADYILVASSHVKHFLVEQGINDSKVKIIPYGYNMTNYYSRNKIINCTINFIFVGRVESAKGIYYLLEAFKRIHSSRCDFTISLVGECCVNIDELTKEYPFAYITGKVPFNQMQEIYQNADVFVLPSLWEGLSLSILEALGNGLPVIATNVSGAEDFIENYVNGFIVNPASVDEIEESILWILNNKDSIGRLSSNALKTSRQFTWDRYTENLNNLIQSLSKKKN